MGHQHGVPAFQPVDTTRWRKRVLGLSRTLTLDEVTHSIVGKRRSTGSDIDPAAPWIRSAWREQRSRSSGVADQPEAADPRRADLGADAQAWTSCSWCSRSCLRGLASICTSPQAAEIRCLCTACHGPARRKVDRRLQPAWSPTPRCRA